MKETALITGASSGIGLDLARLFAKDGHDVVLVARSEGKLREIAAELERDFGMTAHVIVADLAKPDAPQTLVAQLPVDVDVLVNNAGFGVLGPFVETDLAKELEMIQVNVVALTHLTKLLLPPMVARRRGRVLNVASTAAFQPGPLMAVYYATKAYVLSFSEAIADELRDSGVTVTALCPGPTEGRHPAVIAPHPALRDTLSPLRGARVLVALLLVASAARVELLDDVAQPSSAAVVAAEPALA